MRTSVFPTIFLLMAITLAGCGRAPAGAARTAPPATATAMTPPTMAPTTAPTATPTQATFDRRAMLTTIVNERILPHHTQLVTETAALEAQVAAFAADPTPTNLEVAQAQWRRAADAWAAVEIYGLRFTMLVQGQIKKWPINPNFMEAYLIEEETIDAAFIESIGSTARGLAAVEYFLFDLTGTNDEITGRLTAEPKRMAYLVALSENVADKATELHALWSPDGSNQAQAFMEADFSGNNVQGSISMLANEMIVLAEQINKDKLDYPLHGVLSEPQPEAVESPYARYSVPLIARNLESMQEIFESGFTDYLNFLQAGSGTPLAPQIEAKIQQILPMLNALPVPLQDAVVEEPDAVRAIRDEVRALIILLKVDMANQMGITVTFSDSDGD